MLDSAGMTESDLAALRSAAAALEHPGLAARLTNMAGKPIELIGYALPASASQAITAATSKALEMALEVALRSMHQAPRAGSQRLHSSRACRYSHWADGPVRPMLPRADILPCAACWQKA